MSGIYANIDSVGRTITQVPVIIDGVERNTKTGYACVDGVAREFFGGGSVSGTPLNDYVVGTTVYVNVNSVRTPFILVNKGLPATSTNMYDSSCDGMWLVMSNIYEKRQWHSNNNPYTSYSSSTIHSYLNSTFLNLLDSKIKNVIKTVKIPYTIWVTTDAVTGEALEVPSASVRYKTNGLSTRIFLLSCNEVGLSSSDTYEGSQLSYFNSTTRVSYYNGAAEIWYLRTPYVGGTGAYIVNTDGNSSGGLSWAQSVSSSFGIRPAFVLPSDIQVDSNLNIIA